MRRLRRRYGRAHGKTFGRVPVGGLFQLKDDPDNATLEKVSRTHYKVVTAGHPARGLKYHAAQDCPIKRGRQKRG